MRSMLGVIVWVLGHSTSTLAKTRTCPSAYFQPAWGAGRGVAPSPAPAASAGRSRRQPPTCTRVHACRRTHACNACMYAGGRMLATHARACTHVHACMRGQQPTCNMHAHMHACMHTCMHTCIHARPAAHLHRWRASVLRGDDKLYGGGEHWTKDEFLERRAV